MLEPRVRIEAMEGPLVLELERFEAIVKATSYKENYFIRLTCDHGGFSLQVIGVGHKNALTGHPVLAVIGRKWRLSTHMSASEVVLTIFAALLAFEEHEAREAFRFQGQRVLGPHPDLGWIAEQMRLGQFPEDLRQPMDEPTATSAIQAVEQAPL